MPKRGTTTTPKGRDALAKGREARAASIIARKEAKKKDGFMSRKQRWAMLLDGTLAVADLSDEEVKKRQVADTLGSFSGPQYALPSHLLAKFDAEWLKRSLDIVRVGGNKGLQHMVDMLDDPDLEPKDRIAICKYLADRLLGKAEQQVHIKVDDWAGVVGDAVEVERDLSNIEDYANGG